ncbi:MAG: hypothetical protein KDC38_18510, partial [Planctomycetes bacterium]|nr:hypothetical protein [Planctomycetota bacterium]
LAARIAEVATPRALIDAGLTQQSAFQIDQKRGLGLEPSADDLSRFVDWLRRVSDDVPLLIVVNGPEITEALAPALDSCAALDAREPAAVHWLALATEQSASRASQRWPGWADRLCVGELDPESQDRWWGHRLGNWRPPAEVEALLERECEGSPSLLERLFRSLIDCQIVERSEGRWWVGPRADLGPSLLPSGPAGRVLEAIGVAAREATIEAVAAVAQVPIDTVSALVAKLKGRWLVERHGILEFQELRDHFAVRNATTVERWREGKRRLAMFLSTQSSAQGSHARIAETWAATGDVEQTRTSVALAVEEALADGHLPAAHRLLDRALDIAALSPETTELWRSLQLRRGPLESLRVRGRSDAPTRVVLDLLGGGEADFEDSAEIDGDLCRLARAEADPHRGPELPNRMERPEDEGWRLEIRVIQAEVRQGAAAKRAALAEAIAVCESAPEAVSVAWHSYFAARVLEDGGHPELAVPAYRVATRLFGASSLVRFQARSLLREALCQALIGRAASCAGARLRAEALIERAGGIAERRWALLAAEPLGSGETRAGLPERSDVASA